MTGEVLILARRDIKALMKPADWLEAMERGFSAGATGNASSPLPMHIAAEGGAFHAKGASIALGRPYVALKFNGNFPSNPQLRGLPTIQGALILSDASNGMLLALMDSIEVTLRRTAAASALAARLLARPDAETLTICGCGEQGRAHLAALADVLPLKRCFAWDADAAKARLFAAEMDGTGGVGVSAAESLGEAARAGDVIAACTSARTPFLGPDDVRPGAFVAAVGADNEDKSELLPALMAKAAIVTDSTAQCLAMGDLRHAVAAGAVSAGDVRAELGEIAAGMKPGRASADEIIVFDSTGTALQDVAAAAIIYERAQGLRSLPRIPLGML
jgi:ornithine cyclodeaminase/alanine dehydrogenase-like protein (mu-crystallin family)